MSQDSTTLMWRGAIVPALVVSILSTVGSTIVRHHAGLWGALIASVTVVLFLGIHLIISKISENLDPIAVMGLAMFSYVAKLVVMGGLLLFVARVTTPESVDRSCFAITALGITAAWLGGEVRAFFKLRLGLPLPPRTPPTAE